MRGGSAVAGYKTGIICCRLWSNTRRVKAQNAGRRLVLELVHERCARFALFLLLLFFVLLSVPRVVLQHRESCLIVLIEVGAEFVQK